MAKFQVTWKQNGEVFEASRECSLIRFNRPNEVAWRSMPEAEFWKFFKPIQEEKEQSQPAATQQGLFG
jgi:hypothetical protein